MAGAVDVDRSPLNAPGPRLGGRVALGAVPVVFVGALTIWPLVNLATTVINGSTWSRTWRSPGLGRVVWFTTWQAAVSAVATLVVGIAPAYLLSRRSFRGRAVCRALLVIPFFLPTVVVATAFLAVLPQRWHDTPTAMIAAHVFLNVAVVVQIVGTMWAAVPDDLGAAARTLGATPWQVVTRVVLPILRPALASAAAVVFAFCFTSYGVARLLGGPAHPTLEVDIVRRATGLGDIDGAALLSILQLLLIGVTITVSSWLQRRHRLSLVGRSTVRRVTWGDRGVWLMAGIAAAFASPLIMLVARSLRNADGWTLSGWRRLTDSGRRAGLGQAVDVSGAVATSLRFAALAAGIATVVAVGAALTIHLARRWGWLLDVGLAIPLATSAVTIGLGMVITFDRAPFDWRARWWLLPIGHAMVAAPFAVRSILAVIRAIPPDQRAAASTLGASPWRAVWEIEGRALRRPLISVAGIAATISLGEFGATTVLSRAGNETLPLAIARLLGRTGDLPRMQAAALSAILAALCATIIVVSDRVQRTTEQPSGQR